MAREVRRVPKDWQHPTDERGRLRPMFEHADRAEHAKDLAPGEEIDPSMYMPDWPAEVATHYQMYETCSEGTPISPVMANPEDLARWLVDNNASAFGGMTADYEWWLKRARGVPSVGMLIEPGRNPRPF